MKLTGKQVAEELERIVSGADPLFVVGDETWSEAYAGNVDFETASGWRLAIFNNCDELDYVDHAESPDGLKGDCDDWWDASEDPFSQLSESTLAQLEAIVEAARPRVATDSGKEQR